MNKKSFFFVLLGLMICVLLGWFSCTILKNGDNDIWNLQKNLDTKHVLIQGREETTDYPYGYNVGLIKDEKIGEGVLVTPGTTICIDNYRVKENDTIYLANIIHPWVSEQSDGADLNICITSKQGDKYNYSFNVGSNTTYEIIDISQIYKKLVDIEISVDNSNGQDEICDWVVLRDFVITNKEYVFSVPSFNEARYVKSATYFSDEWPLNFWNSEWDFLEKELRQIKDDGFDSIIIVVPWREFQPTIEPISYNEYAFDKLKMLMDTAQSMDIGVYARVSYTWDFYQDADEAIVDRFCRLLGEETVRHAWNEYIKKMYSVLSEYDCYRDGFLTWEDFWNTLGICDIENVNERLQKAQYIGYQTWVQDNYKLDDYNKKYGTAFSSYSDIYVPMRTEPAMYAMYEFYDDFLMDILQEGQKVFPNLSMEVRMDWDVVYKPDGSMDYYKHTDTFSCANSSYTATMYGIPMGFENKGEKVSANEAMEKTEYILEQLKINNENKPVFIEQFIFADNTPKFKNNAQIKEDEINNYLAEVSDILLKYSEGYGIWTYRNYCANMIYNSQFFVNDMQWEHNDQVQIGYDNNLLSSVCKIDKQGYIKQIITPERNHFPGEKYILQFDVKSVVEDGELSVSMGSDSKIVDIGEPKTITLEFDVNENFDIMILSKDCEVIIDNIKLYSQVQQGFMYDENNEELECISGIRVLNKKLEEGIVNE